MQPATGTIKGLSNTSAMPRSRSASASIRDLLAGSGLKAGYLITERNTTGILRDPFTNKPYVSFYAVRRVGGTVVNSEAIKLLKFAAA